MNISITALTIPDIPGFISVITEVYDEYVGVDYPEQGDITFKKFIEYEAVLGRMNAGNLLVAAKDGALIIGAHEIRNQNHIALFFVKKEYHGKGIGRKLFEYSLARIKEDSMIQKITVNSSPYAEKIYARLGFNKTMEMQERDGITFIPMEYIIER